MGMSRKVQSSKFKVQSLLALSALWCVVVLDSSAAPNAPVRELGITSSYGLSAQIFDAAVDLGDLDKGVGHFLLNTIKKCRKSATEKGKSPQQIANMSGNWLEFAMLLALKHEKFTPVYWQAEFAPVPNAYNDVMVWTKEYGPIIMSCKTSLRERYKQADLEAVALRSYYPDGKFYIITLDADKAHLANIRKKLTAGEIVALQTIYAEDNVDELFKFLKRLTITEPPPGALRNGKIVR